MTENTGSEQLDVELTEESARQSLVRECKTGKKVRFEEEVDVTKVIEENTIGQIGRGLSCENVFQEGFVGQSEIIDVGDRKVGQKRPPKRTEEIAIEEANDPEEEAAEAEISSSEIVDANEVLYPDAITPSIKLIVINIILPTIDIYLDNALVYKLFLNGYWGCGVSVIGGIVTNFVVTSFAWQRMESAKQKKWSWIFLLLQLWPQLRAFQVQLPGKMGSFIIRVGSL